MKINEVAKLTGLTVRTLHYYDEIGLLKPSSVSESRYRNYDEECLEILQQILFFRELDFPLNEIKEIMKNPNYNKIEALKKHKELLVQKRKRLDKIINLVDTTIKGDKNMSFKEFDTTEFDNIKDKYASEVKERWGNTEAYANFKEKTKDLDANDWKMINGEGAAILKEFGENRKMSPNSEIAQSLVEKWQAYIDKNFYKCSKEILSCLGQMYAGDERFAKNIDKNGEGTARFMAEAIAIYCAK